ncbi:MAG: hypothetical protein ABEK59_04740 [Halobacteria archaeon]
MLEPDRIPDRPLTWNEVDQLDNRDGVRSVEPVMGVDSNNPYDNVVVLIAQNTEGALAYYGNSGESWEEICGPVYYHERDERFTAVEGFADWVENHPGRDELVAFSEAGSFDRETVLEMFPNRTLDPGEARKMEKFVEPSGVKIRETARTRSSSRDNERVIGVQVASHDGFSQNLYLLGYGENRGWRIVDHGEGDEIDRMDGRNLELFLERQYPDGYRIA